MGLQGSQFAGEDDIPRRLKDLERQVRELAAANQLGSAGIKAVEGGITVEGSQTVNGPLTINGPLTLQPGSIENDSLTNPFSTQTSSNFLNNYAINTTSTVRTSVTFTVPDGYTQAVVIANPTAMGQNSTGAVDYLYAQAVIYGVGGGELYTSAGAGLAVGLASPVHLTLTGLVAGEPIEVSVATRTGFGTWAAAPGNQANIYATAIFLR